MRKIRIFCLPAHTYADRVSGVDYLRVIQPMTHLNGYKDDEVEFEVKVFNHAKDGSFDWNDVFKEYDAVYFNYTTNDIGYAVMGCLAQKYKKKLICDIDDDLFNILPDNSAYEIFKKGSWPLQVVKAALGDVHHVTCTNNHLKHSIQHNCKPKGISVLPNYIDLDLYKHRSPFKDRGYYKALHFGSTTHFHSLYSDHFVEGLRRVMQDYPNFSFTTIGASIPQFKDKWGMRYAQGYGDSDILKWIEKMPTYTDDADFMIVPLVNNTYNRSKSSTKYLEASSTMLPGCWQDIRQYRELVRDGVNGYLCTTADDWYRCITSLINDAKLRRRMGEQAFETTGKWTIQDNIKKYADVFKMILTK